MAQERDLREGIEVLQTSSCNSAERGNIYKVYKGSDDQYCIGDNKDNPCRCTGSWEIVREGSFKIGDRVIRNGVEGRSGMTNVSKKGWKGTITDLSNRGLDMKIKRWEVKWDAGETTEPYEDQIQLLTTSKKTIMKTIKNIAKKLLDADTKKLLQAELINGDLERTEEGTDALLDILFLEKKADMVAVADEIIAESEKRNK